MVYNVPTMNLSDLYEHLTERMAETRKQYVEISSMIENAKVEGIDFTDWPQYVEYLGLKAKWATYNEIKIIVSNMMNDG